MIIDNVIQKVLYGTAVIDAYVDAAAEVTGFSEPALRFLLALALEFPVALVMRIVFLRPCTSVDIRNWYIIVTGLLSAWFFCHFSREILPAIGSVIFTWGFLRLACTVFQIKRLPAVTCVWIGNCGYLMYCYYHFASATYDINWLTPQSVMCLRLLSLATDFYDGGKTKGASERALAMLPSLRQTLGYCFFPGTYLAGPQLSFARYHSYLTGEMFIRGAGELPQGGYRYALRCILLGASYFLIQVVGDKYVSMATLKTQWYSEQSFWFRLAFMWIAGKLYFNKYLGVWVFNEAACAITGISFAGNDPVTKQPLWNGLSNVVPSVYEFPSCLNDIIASFNINTNNWGKVYVYKRLRFLGNKHISSFGALLFLCFWHGYHIGYPICFALEFVLMMIENWLSQLLSPLYESLYRASFAKSNIYVKLARFIKRIVGYVLTTVFLHYALISFALLHWRDMHAAYSALYYCGHWCIALGLVLMVLFPARPRTDNKVRTD